MVHSTTHSFLSGEGDAWSLNSERKRDWGSSVFREKEAIPGSFFEKWETIKDFRL